VRIEALHLVSGACDADFNRNGLNSALRSYRVGRVFVYVAEKDWAMGFEDTLAGKALFGLYASDQPLGLSGPRNVESRMYSRIKQVNERHYGHSSWWAPVNFERTMRGFVLI
jgi:hypothetical protein